MLNLFRRHTHTCPNTSRKDRKCSCPLHVEGSFYGDYIRMGLDTRSWEAAQRMIREWEATGTITTTEGTPNIVGAVERFFEEAEVRGLRPSTIEKYTVLLRKQLLPFCQMRGYRQLKHLGIQEMRDFRGSWKDAPLAASKKLERLRSFFKFCVESKWMDENPARRVQMPKVSQKPTLPFDTDEVERIFEACDRYSIKGIYGKASRDRIRAFVLVLRYTGLRIGDVVRLKKDNVKDGKVFLYTQKTGTPVWVPVPPMVTRILSGVPNVGERFFWSGDGKPKSAVADWQRSLRKLFTLAKVDGGHAHRFRDTFAVELLLAGVAVEDVAILLGHSSKDITEKHYAPWVAARQARLEAAVRSTWPEDKPRLVVIQGGA